MIAGEIAVLLPACKLPAYPSAQRIVATTETTSLVELTDPIISGV
jgi:hypothetical protein